MWDHSVSHLWSNLKKVSICKDSYQNHNFKTINSAVKETTQKDALVISAEYVASPRSNQMLQQVTEAKCGSGQQFCPQCSLGLDIKHTDVLILSQYLRSDGCMLPRRITGLCKRQQRRIGSLVIMAQKAGLMPNIGPSWSKRDPKKRYQWKKYNKYFDESTIKC